MLKKELVSGEFADPDYFGRDTGDASKDDPRNGDEIGENELLVSASEPLLMTAVLLTSRALRTLCRKPIRTGRSEEPLPPRSLSIMCRLVTEKKIDNVQQALDRAVENGVKNLVIQPTHLMYGAEYDELAETVESYQDKFESVQIAAPLLGDVGTDATVINEDKKLLQRLLPQKQLRQLDTRLWMKQSRRRCIRIYGSRYFPTAKVSYSQMQAQMDALGYDNVFIGTVEGERKQTACDAVIESIKEAGYKKVILRPLMVVAGDHANNDMAGDDADSWKSMFNASGAFESVDTQIAGLGRLPAIHELYVAHTGAVIDQ